MHRETTTPFVIKLPWTPKTLSGEDSPGTPDWHLRSFLAAYPSLFSANPCWTDCIQHIIETPIGWVSRTALRPLPRSCWRMVDKEVQDMLRLRVTKPSNSTMDLTKGYCKSLCRPRKRKRQPLPCCRGFFSLHSCLSVSMGPIHVPKTCGNCARAM